MTEELEGSAMAKALLSIAATMLGPIGEAVDGYRADLQRRGYSNTASEKMAVDYHRYVLNLVSQSTNTPG